MFVGILTQITDFRLDAAKFQGEISVYRKDVNGNIAEILNFRDTTTV